jgi:hypothetical protein
MSIKSISFVGVAATVLACAFTQPALAHHSFGMFDLEKSVTVEGTVKDFQWNNPHVWIDLVITDPTTHQPVGCSVEADAINIMTNKGWTRNSLKAGDQVKLEIHPLKSGALGGALVSATVNGQAIGHAVYRPQ